MSIKVNTSSAILAAMLPIASMADWKVETRIDEMTDVKQYIIWTTGTVVRINSLVDYTPQLQIRLISPKYKRSTDSLLAKFELMFSIDAEGLVRRGAEVLYRIDADEAVKETWSPASGRHGAFAPHPHDLYKALKSAKTFRIRYVTTLGDIRTTRFDVSGLERATQTIKEEFRLLAPENEPPPPDPKLVAKAGTTLKDVAEALAYAEARAGTMPRMQSELTLTKPLKALKDAIAKKEQAASNFKTIEDRFNNLKPGNISRPSRAKLERARETLATAEKELASAVAEVRRLSLQILQTTDWPTPELSAAAKAAANYIPRR